MVSIDRRAALMTLLAACLAPARSSAATLDDAPLFSDPAAFAWDPSRSPRGPLLVAIATKPGLIRVWRGGALIGKARLAAGPSPDDLPAGVFHLLARAGADTGHAWPAQRIHRDPGAAQRGQIVLPDAFRAKVAGIAAQGAGCVVAADHSPPNVILTDAGLFLAPSEPLDTAIAGTLAWSLGALRPWRAPPSLVISLAEARGDLVVAGRVAASVDLALVDSEPLVGSFVYQLVGRDGSRLRWLALGLHGARALDASEERNALAKIAFVDTAVGLGLLMRLRPGSLMVLSETRERRVAGAVPAAQGDSVTLFGETPARHRAVAAARPAVAAKPGESRPWPRRQLASRPQRRLSTVDAMPIADDSARKFFPDY
jgi:hypothetical protein